MHLLIFNLFFRNFHCRCRSSIPKNDHSAFVLAFNVSPLLSEEPHFQFAVSTKYLLSVAMNSTILHADATYKLNSNGYPVLMVGCSDFNRQFHPLLIGITVTETESDFAFMFTTLKNAISQHHFRLYEPTVLIADSAPAIKNAFIDVFGDTTEDITVINCFTHVIKNVRQRKYAMSAEKKVEMLKDVRTLHEAASKKIFDSLKKLFIAKHKAERDACDYFNSVWFDKLWYEDVRHFTPSTNNGLEGMNAVIKRDYTHRERLPLEKFKSKLMSMVGEISVRNSNCKTFHFHPTITYAMWHKAVEWLELE